MCKHTFSWAAPLGLLLILTSDSSAQRFTERWITINPLGAKIGNVDDDDWSFLGLGHFWGEFGAYRLVRDNEHAWSGKVGGFVELFRLGNRMSFAFAASSDFIADPHNDIRFNPRAVLWEEGFLLTFRSGETFTQLGYYHRCKHDVDNLGAPPDYSVPVQRSLIYGSLFGRVMVPFSLPSFTNASLLALRGDLYTILQDERTPRSFAVHSRNLEQMIGSAGISVHTRFSMTEGGGLGGYVTGYSALTLFGEERGFSRRLRSVHSGTFDGGVAAGIALQGNIHLRIGISYEYLSDTYVPPIPGDAHLVLLSIAMLNPDSM